MMKKIFP